MAEENSVILQKIETNSTDILNRLFGDISEMFNFEQQHKISNSLQGFNLLLHQFGIIESA